MQRHLAFANAPEGAIMIQGQYEPSGQKQLILVPRRSRLLQQHPVLIPLLPIGSSVGLCIASFSAGTLFPAIGLIGAPSALLCILVALVLGISGILISIIYIIERIDGYCSQRLQAEAFPQPKEHNYAN
jgi:hypothetical protein